MLLASYGCAVNAVSKRIRFYAAMFYGIFSQSDGLFHRIRDAEKILWCHVTNGYANSSHEIHIFLFFEIFLMECLPVLRYRQITPDVRASLCHVISPW